jgi:drug/metabolite transporter (DMT)-like permease
MISRIYRADALLLLTAIIWGTAFVAQRVGMEHVGPMIFNGVRFGLGALILLPIALRGDTKSPGRHKASWWVLSGGGLAGLVLFIAASLQQIGLVYTTAGKAGFITGLYVVIVPLFGFFIGHQIGVATWLGAILAAAGMYFLSVTAAFTIAPGDLLELIGACFWAGHVLILGWLAPSVNPIQLACGQFATCALLSLVAALATETITLTGLEAATIPILYGGVLSVAVGYTLQVVAQRNAPPAHAAIILSLEAVFAVVGGWLVLGESLGQRGILGCALMLTGMLVVQLFPPSLDHSR